MQNTSDVADVVGITAGDGARATIHLDGAHVTSWTPSGTDSDRLFVSARSGFGPGVSIRGGIPVIFPQFGAEGVMPRHGFARTARWTLVSASEQAHDASAMFRLSDDARTRAIWPYAFVAELQVVVHGATLDVTLSVENTGDSAAQFTAALHPYFRMMDAFQAQIVGLQGLQYRDALRERAVESEAGTSLAIHGELDRVYFSAPDHLEIREPDRVLRIEKRGFPDAVVWNPGESGTRGRADFEPGDERIMLCVEAAAVQQPVVLAPGARWSGSQSMTAVR